MYPDTMRPEMPTTLYPKERQIEKRKLTGIIANITMRILDNNYVKTRRAPDETNDEWDLKLPRHRQERGKAAQKFAEIAEMVFDQVIIDADFTKIINTLGKDLNNPATKNQVYDFVIAEVLDYMNLNSFFTANHQKGYAPEEISGTNEEWVKAYLDRSKTITNF